MTDSRILTSRTGGSYRSQSGILSKLRLENFMCHSNLEIEFCDWVNFITGQNGSGKSAILTALCVAFGCRARGTQRALALKDFIKTGCSYALVHVEIKNQGEDAFKPEKYGDIIIIERRVSESTSSTTLKDHQGKRVASQKAELDELVEHFNIDVENPCVIMSQDKSREFLHSGNDKDKFKFFFKATLLHQLDGLLKGIEAQLSNATALVDDLESSISPIVKELDDLQEKIKNLEHVEELSQQVQLLKKKLAWAWVYDVVKQLQEQTAKIEELKGRIEELKDILAKKKARIECMVERTAEVRRMKDELEDSLSMARAERNKLNQEYGCKTNHIERMVNRIKVLEQQIHDIHEQHIKATQAEEHEMEGRLKELQDEFDKAKLTLQRLKEEEDALSESLATGMTEIKKIDSEIGDNERKRNQIFSNIREIQQHQTNKVTAFGGSRVISLLKAIERHQKRFKKLPIGPIGAHLTLLNGDMWAIAVENAFGRLLNAFIVTDHSDSLVLRACAKEANYNRLQIVIYDFSRPRLTIPNHMLPQTKHPTVVSAIYSESPIVVNVLIDIGNAERQVLVKDYDEGKSVAFDQRISNLKEVFTLEGYRMFYRGSAQTVLPPNKNVRSGRLYSSYDEQVKNLEREASKYQELTQQGQGKKRKVEEDLLGFQDELQRTKRRRQVAERELSYKSLALEDVKNSYAAENNLSPATNVDELRQEISKVQDEIRREEIGLEKIQVSLNELDTKANNLKISIENLRESTKEEILAFEKVENDVMVLEEDLQHIEAEKVHYERCMNEKVLPAVEGAEAQYQELKHHHEESYKKASIICPECEIEELGGCGGITPEQLSAQLSRLNQRLQRESQRNLESIDDLRMLYKKKELRIFRKQQTYKAYREKLHACRKALDLRWSKFWTNATHLKRQLTWQFNGHLRKKGISGHVKVNYEEERLSVEVKMPHDTSNSAVRDTRGLSGGERSFSTLCFALALHEMTEAPFRAMDEFDVFMDAVSRKISLDTLVDFALAQGSQWIFITPHDISMVKLDERIKKQQMTAPRS